MNTEFELNGRHVLLMLLSFFAAVIAVNAVFIAFAVRSYPGEQEKKSYRQGLQYNAVLEDRAAQAALGWRASIDVAAKSGALVRIVVSMKQSDRRPLEGLSLSGALLRPASDEGGQSLLFSPQGGGRYEAFADARAGVWDLSVTAASEAGERFQFTNRVIFQ